MQSFRTAQSAHIQFHAKVFFPALQLYKSTAPDPFPVFIIIRISDCSLITHKNPPDILPAHSFSEPLQYIQGVVFLVLVIVQIFHIIYDHKRNLEGQCIIEIPQIESGALLELFNPVDQRISVNKKLS